MLLIVIFPSFGWAQICTSGRCVQTSQTLATPATIAARQWSVRPQATTATGPCGNYAVDPYGRCTKTFHLPRMDVQNVQGNLSASQWLAGLGAGWKTSVRFTNLALNSVQVDVLFRGRDGNLLNLWTVDNVYSTPTVAGVVMYPTLPGQSWELRAASAASQAGPVEDDAKGTIDVRFNAWSAADLDAQGVGAVAEELWFRGANGSMTRSRYFSIVGNNTVPDGIGGFWTFRFGLQPQADSSALDEGEVIGLSLANPGAVDITVHCTLRLSDGNIVGQRDVVVPAGGFIDSMLVDFFTGSLFPNGKISVGSLEFVPSDPSGIVTPFLIKIKGDGGSNLPGTLVPFVAK